MSIFTLAPIDHPTDPTVLEHGYKIWSTYAESLCLTRMFVRSNKPETAGGQTWLAIAEFDGVTWRVQRGEGMFGQGGGLLGSYLMATGNKVRTVVLFDGEVTRYDATAKVYSLPSILNGMQAVVSRDKRADARSAERKTSLADLMAARETRAKETAK